MLFTINISVYVTISFFIPKVSCMVISNYMNAVFYTIMFIKVNCITMKAREGRDESPHKLRVPYGCAVYVPLHYFSFTYVYTHI